MFDEHEVDVDDTLTRPRERHLQVHVSQLRFE